ncbi:MAG TPA: SLC13 family permease [Verrucomicrobiae bacterium]|nr:SLC13 family permease [Verrucomicrobiae bacterium]
MSNEAVITFVILGVSIVLFVSERLPADLVALLVVAMLGAFGILTPLESFSGFSRSAIIIIAAILVLADGLERAGLSDQVGNLLLRLAGKGEAHLMLTVMLAAAFLSLFMNNIAAASVLLPAALGAGRKTGVPRSRLMMPLAFATLLGGMATLFTTTNIVTSTLLREEGVRGFGVLDFAGVGVPLVIAGIGYMAVWGQKSLPRPADQSPTPHAPHKDLVEMYDLSDYLFRARIPANSPLVHQRLGESKLREKFGVTLVGIQRNHKQILVPGLDTVFEEGDVLLLAGEMEVLLFRDLGGHFDILPLSKWQEEDLESESIVMAEVMVSPRSRLIDQTLGRVHFHKRYGLTVLAIWRAGRQIYVGLHDLPLQLGDILLVQGSREQLTLLRDDPDLIRLTGRETELPRRVKGKGWLALAIFVATLVFATIGPLPVAEIMLCGALIMILCHVLTMEQAYQAIEWRLVFLVAGMLPMGIAMTKTGTASLLANWMVKGLGPAGPLMMLAGLMILTILLSQAMKGAAVAAVMVPIAIQAARQIGADPRALAMGVALATSMAFITPLGHPVNILVMSEGGYNFRDYMRVGLPLTILLLLVVLLVLPLVWPLTVPPHP